MNLLTLCQALTEQADINLPKNHVLSERLVCPEYSRIATEVKSYPLLESEQVFALCWNFSSHNTLYTTMLPSPALFSYPCNLQGLTKTQLHTHSYLELAYIVKGTFRQRILNKDILFQKGDFCLIDKNCIHQDDLQNQDSIILFLGISNDIFHNIMDENITQEKIIAFLQSALLTQKDVEQYLHFRPSNDIKTHPTAFEEIENYLYFLVTELQHPGIGSNYIYKGLLLKIFRILSTSYEFSLSKEQRKTMTWIIFEEVSDYMQSHYRDVTIQDLVSLFHFHEDYFNRLIKSKTGLTYSAYLQKIRLEKAEKLLLTTNLTIDEIAESIGYHNKGYFYKLFFQKNQKTPSQFRKKR